MRLQGIGPDLNWVHLSQVTLNQTSNVHRLKKKFVLFPSQVDVTFYFEREPDEHVQCKLPVHTFDGGPPDGTGFVVFQCHGKKMNFFSMMLFVQIILLGISLSTFTRYVELKYEFT